MSKLRLVYIGAIEDMSIVKHYIPSGTYKRIGTSYSVRIESAGYSLVWSTKPIGDQLLGILSKIKAHVKKNTREGTCKPESNREDPPRFSEHIPLETGSPDKPFVEIDLSAAYCTAARNLGALSENMYHYLMKITKSSRLMAIGALGSVHFVTEYENWQKTASYIDKSDTTPVWQSIIREVDREMRYLKAAAGAAFILYWTDAIMVEPSAADRIISLIPSTRYFARVKARGYLRRHKQYIITSDGRRFPLAS